MSRLAIDPAAAAAEIAAAGARLAQAARQLAAIGPAEAQGAPRTRAFEIDGTVLWRYRPEAPASIPPLLICYALVNRPTMLDLEPRRSLIRGLLAHGVEVYLVDWGRTRTEDRGLTLADYVGRRLGACLDHVRAAHGLASVNLVGVCQGGCFALCHAALHPERVRNLVTMVTPVDFATPDNLLAKWARRLDVERLVEAQGNVPGALLTAAFVALQPLRLGVGKYAGLADIAGDREALETFARMERWIHDSPDQAGAAFAEFVQRFFRDNAFVRGGLSIGGQAVDLSRIRCPVLNVYARRDHLVPPAASKALARLTGSADYSELEFDGGHIGIYVSRGAQELLPRSLAQWLQGR